MTGIADAKLSDPEGIVHGDRGAAGENARWYAVHTQPKREFYARLQLEGQGFRVFLPKGLKTIRHARKMADVEAAFFPRYLFVELDLTRQPWRRVNGTFGVTNLVMQGDLPHPVPRGVIETMAASIDRKGLLRFDQGLVVGAQVRLTAGPFAEQLGILDRLDGSGRVRVLLEILGGPIPVEIRREFVRAIA
jgi:transcription antitermination factor NusG